MLNGEGYCYTQLKKPDEAIADFARAAAVDPNPGTAYFNLCTTECSAGAMSNALGACEKAIQANPDMANAYYIKGSILAAQSKADETGKVQAPLGTMEALNKYLQLAPRGD